MPTPQPSLYSGSNGSYTITIKSKSSLSINIQATIPSSQILITDYQPPNTAGTQPTTYIINDYQNQAPLSGKLQLIPGGDNIFRINIAQFVDGGTIYVYDLVIKQEYLDTYTVNYSDSPLVTTDVSSVPVTITPTDATYPVTVADVCQNIIYFSGTGESTGNLPLSVLGDNNFKINITVNGVLYTYDLIITKILPANVPGAPTNVTATTGDDSSSVVSWIAPASDGGAGIAGYIAYSSPGGFRGVVKNGSATSVTVSGLTNGTS